MNARSVCAAFFAVAIAVLVCTTATDDNDGFVRARGTLFYVNGTPWYCAGTNAYYAGLQYIMPETEVEVMMKSHASEGANVLRVFAHSNFATVPSPMMPSFGKFDDAAIRRLDVALAMAAKYDVKLILVLGNYWPFLGGVQEWVNAYKSGGDASLFYTDATLKNHFKAWIRHVVTRTNTVTGKAYVDDTTIFAWELMNEPRLRQGGDAVVCAWVREMAAYVKSLDRNHLVCAGDEGFLANGSTLEPHSWINRGYEGVDFRCHLGIPDIDFGTVHAYPDQWGMDPPKGYEWLADNFLKSRAEIARSLRKPVILEEYGQARGYYGPRDALLSWIHNAVNAEGYACTIVWAASHRGTDGTMYGKDDQGYAFFYGDDGTTSLRRQYRYMKSRRGA